MKTIIVTKYGVYRDGGTEEYRDKERNRYFKDGRINTKTPGKIYDKHPSEPGAKMIDVLLVTET